ncbi:hypothetical protein Tco_0817150 [Tanacetum coccineum]
MLRNHLFSPPDPITPPAILTPSPVLPPSLLFDPRYFFVPEELLPPKMRTYLPSISSTNPSRNQTCNLVSPSFLVYTPTPPQILEIGKIPKDNNAKDELRKFVFRLSYFKGKQLAKDRLILLTLEFPISNKSLRRTKLVTKQIRRIFRIMPPKRTSTSKTPTITLAAIQQLITNGIATALEAQAATMASASNPNRNTGPTGIPELAVLCPNMVPNTEKLMEVFISGLPRSIEGNVTASKPQTLEEATNIAQRLMDQIIRHDSVQETNNHKRKLEDKRNIINNNNYQNNY